MAGTISCESKWRSPLSNNDWVCTDTLRRFVTSTAFFAHYGIFNNLLLMGKCFKFIFMRIVMAAARVCQNFQSEINSIYYFFFPPSLCENEMHFFEKKYSSIKSISHKLCKPSIIKSYSVCSIFLFFQVVFLPQFFT